MGVLDDGERVTAADAAAWRAWLDGNHGRAAGVWLLSVRGNAASGVGYEDAVRQALCFGWIDGPVRTFDDGTVGQWFSPRRPASGWAAGNKARIAEPDVTAAARPVSGGPDELGGVGRTHRPAVGTRREELDAYAVASHRRAAAAWEEGFFDRTAIAVAEAPDAVADETVRPGTTVDALAGLAPSFRTDALAARFPNLDWRITPGNSSPLTDGASAALLMSAERAAELGLTPRARFHAFAVVGDDPLMMLTGPIPATARILESAGLAIDDIDAYEVNEAFASVPLAWAAETGADPARLNPRGGAIALGHALGSSGTRLLGTLVDHLDATGGRYGLQTMCEGGGMANATLIERL